MECVKPCEPNDLSSGIGLRALASANSITGGISVVSELVITSVTVLQTIPPNESSLQFASVRCMHTNKDGTKQRGAYINNDAPAVTVHDGDMMAPEVYRFTINDANGQTSIEYDTTSKAIMTITGCRSYHKLTYDTNAL